MKHYCFKYLAAALSMFCMAVQSSVAYAEEDIIDPYKTDFCYEGIEYQIISDSERTVAVAQSFDIDSDAVQISNYVPSRNPVGQNGFLTFYGLWGSVVIPETVYDSNGSAYTVKALAHGAINYVGIDVLILPPTLEKINGGIVALPVNSLYLPSGLQEISGINSCPNLNSITLPWNLKSIRDNSLMRCGFQSIFLPPSVSTLGKNVLSYCDELQTLILSNVEKLGDGCFSDCNSLYWANLPETLKIMGDGCFNNCKDLRRVSLPWSEINMNNCFNGCTSINCIELLSTEPYKFPENCFLDIDKGNCDLLVPEESLEKYMAADGWKDFYRINGVPTSGQSGVHKTNSASGFVAIGGNGSLKIVNAGGECIDIIDTAGIKCATVSNAGVSEITMPKGLYIVGSSSQSYKVRVM